jgi:hypothetical protein
MNRRALLLTILLLFVALDEGRAQCDLDQTFTGLKLWRKGTTDTLQGNSNVWAYWSFESLYDSADMRYLITEFKRNNDRLLLKHWCSGTQHVSWSPSTLLDSSRTKAFKVFTGDTLSFYREFLWWDKFDSSQKANNFFSRDTLDYVVELIKNSDGSRVGLVDSVGVLRRTTRGYPTFYGTNPILARVKFGIIASLNGDSVYLRVRATQRGDGAYDLRRRDFYGVNLSGHLNDTNWQNYGSGTWKRSSKELEAALTGKARIMATPNPTSGLVHVRFDGLEPDRVITIAVYDATGRLVKFPYSTRGVSEGATDVLLDDSGVYFIAAISGGRVLGASRVTVTK